MHQSKYPRSVLSFLMRQPCPFAMLSHRSAFFAKEEQIGWRLLSPGERVVLYTDGLVERRTEPIDDSLARLQAAADGFSGTLAELCDHLMVAMPVGDGPRDDTAIIALERR